MKLSLALFVTLLGFSFAAKAQDVLLQKNLSVITDQYDQVLLKTEANVKLFVDNFTVKLDSGSKVTSPKVVAGTVLQPILKVSIQKCVFIICNTIDLDSQFTLVKNAANPTCDNSYTLLGDLRRSSQLLTNNYTALNTSICLKKTATGAQAALSVTLTRASSFSSDIVQSETLKFIKLQASSIVDSFSKVLVLNGVKQVN